MWVAVLDVCLVTHDSRLLPRQGVLAAISSYGRDLVLVAVMVGQCSCCFVVGTALVVAIVYASLLGLGVVGGFLGVHGRDHCQCICRSLVVSSLLRACFRLRCSKTALAVHEVGF